MLLNRFIKHLTSVLLPNLCVICGETSQDPSQLCLLCLQKMPILANNCPQCALNLPPSTSHIPCGVCLTNPPPFERTFALSSYDGIVAHLVSRLKFNHDLSLAQSLGQLLLKQIKQSWYLGKALPDLLLPMPLHRSRLRERGFNQAIEIAKPLIKELKLPLDRVGTQRVKATAAQSSLAAHDRRRNVAQAFAAYRNYNGLTIALLDDVVTTGHTITACSHALKQAGAKAIHVWCCARSMVDENLKNR